MTWPQAAVEISNHWATAVGIVGVFWAICRVCYRKK